MIIESIAAIAAGVGMKLIAGVKTGDQKSEMQEAVDKILEEKSSESVEEEAKSTQTSEQSDPRNNSMYFGDKTREYDPFYDFSNDQEGFDSEYGLTSIEGSQELLGRAFRSRIVRPFLTAKKVFFSDKYEHLGWDTQELKVDAWNEGIPALPMVKGSYTELSFIVEVFNPFDFAVPCQKMRISTMSLGGDRICPIPSMGENGSHLINASEGYWWRNLGATHFGLSSYWSQYLLKGELNTKDILKASDDNITKRCYSRMLVNHNPSDFEIELIKNYKETSQRMVSYGQIAKGTGTINYDQFWAKDTNTRLKIVNLYEKNSVSQLSYFKEVSDLLGVDLDKNSGNVCDGLNPISFAKGLKTPFHNVSEMMMIPAKGSILVKVTIPVAKIKKMDYCGCGYIYDSKDSDKKLVMKNMVINRNMSDDVPESDKSRLIFTKDISGLSKDDLKYMQDRYAFGNKGGYLFVDIEEIGAIDEKDFRMKAAFFSMSSQSRIQNHNTGFEQKNENSRWSDLGMYRGGRPSVGDYEWEKSYWERTKAYESMEDAIESEMPGLNVNWSWNFTL